VAFHKKIGKNEEKNTNEARTWPRYLRDHELGDPLGESSFLAGQDHLQHVSVELLHYHEHPLRRLEHAVQVDHARVVQTLEEEEQEEEEETMVTHWETGSSCSSR